MKKLGLPIMAFAMVVLLTLLSVSGAGASPAPNGQATCPADDGWVKIDSDDLSLYPVTDADDYCFKAGSDNSQGCNGGLFDSWPQPEGTCGLSHWSYHVPDGPPPPPPPPDDPPPPPRDPPPGHSCNEYMALHPDAVRPAHCPAEAGIWNTIQLLWAWINNQFR